MGPWRFLLAVLGALSPVAVSLVDGSPAAAAGIGVTGANASSAGDSQGSAGNGSENSCHAVFNGDPTGSLVKTTSAGPDNSTVSPGQTITVTLTWNPADFGGHSPSRSEDCVQIGSKISTALSLEHVPGPTSGTDTFSYVVPLDGTEGQQICDRGAVFAGQGEGDGSGSVLGDRSGTGSDESENGTAGGAGKGQDSGVRASGVDPSVTLSGQNGGGSGASSGDSQGTSQGGDHVEKSAVLCYTLLSAAAPEAPTAILFPMAGLVIVGGAVLVARRRKRRSHSPTPL